MKKEFFLAIIALLISFFAFKAIIHASDQYDDETVEVDNDYCANCCAAGRTVSTECCEKCNACQAYSDEGAAECRDVPA